MTCVPSVSTFFSPTASTTGFFPFCCALSGLSVCGRLSIFSRYALFTWWVRMVAPSATNARRPLE